MSPEEIAKLWESIGKTGLTQYKLKVDLNQDCMELINRDGGSAAGAAPGPGGLASSQGQKSELFQSVRTNVMDMQLDATVGLTAGAVKTSQNMQALEESKEQPDVQRGAPGNRIPGGAALPGAGSQPDPWLEDCSDSLRSVAVEAGVGASWPSASW